MSEKRLPKYWENAVAEYTTHSIGCAFFEPNDGVSKDCTCAVYKFRDTVRTALMEHLSRRAPQGEPETCTCRRCANIPDGKPWTDQCCTAGASADVEALNSVLLSLDLNCSGGLSPRECAILSNKMRSALRSRAGVGEDTRRFLRLIRLHSNEIPAERLTEHRVPEGTCLVGRVYVTATGEIVVTDGWPSEDVPEDHPDSHNCDEMGCSSCFHVVARLSGDDQGEGS